jgi:hypothetical protein
MSIYKKRVSVGAFLKKGTDFKDGDIVEIANEGKQTEGQFGVQDIFLIKLADGREGNVSFNQTSLNNLIDGYGENSINWIGKGVKVISILSNVQGKMLKVYYFLHPDAELDERTGQFLIKGKKELPDGVNEEDIPTVEDDIDVKEIPF